MSVTLVYIDPHVRDGEKYAGITDEGRTALEYCVEHGLTSGLSLFYAANCTQDKEQFRSGVEWVDKLEEHGLLVFLEQTPFAKAARSSTIDNLTNEDIPEVGHVVVPELRDVGSNVREATDMLNAVLHHGAAVHIASIDATIRPDDDDAHRLMEGFAGMETYAAKQEYVASVKEDVVPAATHSGRPPLGFDIAGGRLEPADDYEEVVAALKLVQEGALSKRQAARDLDTSRKTINRCLQNRPELYNLDD